MKVVIQWIRLNLITSISIVVAITALIAIFYIYSQGSQFTSKVKSQSGGVSNINRYMHGSVQIPPNTLTGDPRSISNVVINKKAIDDLKTIYQKINTQRMQFINLLSKINQDHHVVLEKDLFPESKSDQVRYDARSAYKKSFKPMLSSLDAGMPVSQERLQAVVDRVDTNFKREQANTADQSNSNTRGGRKSMTAAQIKQIRQRKQIALISELRSHAKSISIYADTQAALSDDNYPYTVDAWAFAGSKPTMAQLWEAQLELWIQQDITKAINQANHNLPGEKSSQSNAVNNPIKRLIKMRVVPGYVGLQTRGDVPIAESQAHVIAAVTKASQNNSSSKNEQSSVGDTHSLSQFFSSSRGYGDKENAKQNADGTYPPPVNHFRTDNTGKPIAKNFYISTTGRTTSPVYDVRQVKLSMIIDYRELPEIINAFSKINFMTVLHCNIYDVNTYAAMASGFYYGSGNIVRADMIIETLWFRNWTRKLMPKKVRQYVGITKAPEPKPSGSAPAQANKPKKSLKFPTAGKQ